MNPNSFNKREDIILLSYMALQKHKKKKNNNNNNNNNNNDNCGDNFLLQVNQTNSTLQPLVHAL